MQICVLYVRLSSTNAEIWQSSLFDKDLRSPNFKERNTMSNDKPIKPADNQSNMQNPNKGTAGTNRQYDQNQGNRGGQLNPNRKGK